MLDYSDEVILIKYKDIVKLYDQGKCLLWEHLSYDTRINNDSVECKFECEATLHPVEEAELPRLQIYINNYYMIEKSCKWKFGSILLGFYVRICIERKKPLAWRVYTGKYSHGNMLILKKWLRYHKVEWSELK